MAWMQCRSCTAKFAVGLLWCPQCNAMSELYAVPEEVIEAEQEANVPKISVANGPSNALGEPLEEEVPAAEPAETSEHLEPETSDATSGALDEGAEPDEGADAAEASPAASGAAVTAESVAAPASKPAKKAAAKKTAAKVEPAPKG
jgi:hypothetical protein